MPYWNRLKGDLILEPVLDVDISEFYTVPKKTRNAFIPTPFIYEGVLMMSFCYPIIKSNSFLGVAGLDISIETIKKLLKSFEERKLYESNYALLVSDTGIIISASNELFEKHILDKKTISEMGKELNFSEYEVLSKEIQERKEGFLNTKDPFNKQETVSFYSPIKTGNLSIIVSISKSDLLANTLNGIYILSIIGIISLLVVGVILYFLINTIIDPLNKLTDTVIEFGKHDFSKRSSVSTNDEIGALSKSFNAMADSIEEYSNEMEAKITKRTQELNNSLIEITKLKYQQDGDYFLTSILLNPFFKKIQSTEKYKVDFLIAQKKTFEFKQRKLSIGGDICYTDTIHLKNKSYIFFVNGDAMGKSLQGAGGALILGSVLGSIIERTKTSVNAQNNSPERWLKNTFKELHKTFETFDGLMLVSVVIGLIEEESGVMYYLNAEHPFTILYRDECASFIEESVDLRKLGTPSRDGKLFIKVFKLRHNDIIFIGSDGKDDLVLNSGSEGSREINSDETLFLKVVEKSKGDLGAINENLRTFGELMDDLSILRIEYSSKVPLIEKEVEKTTFSNRIEAIDFLENIIEIDPSKLKRLSKLYISEGNFRKANERILKYLEYDPSDTNALYMACYCSVKLGIYPKAIEFIQRCLLREPHNLDFIKLEKKILQKS